MGAIATVPLDAAWSVGYVACPECGVQAKLDAEVLRALGEQAAGARVTIERLVAAG